MSNADIIQFVIIGIIYTGLITIFIIVGRKWSKGQWLSLIAGYNTETKSEKDKYNTLELSKFMAIVAYVNSFFICLFLPIIYLVIKYKMLWLLYFLIVDIIVFDVYAAIHSNKYKVHK
ncbi:MAG: DUF3784 domain-containing protein [Clostridiaceae bacterium]